MENDDFLPICIPENGAEIRAMYKRQRARIAELKALLEKATKNETCLWTCKLKAENARLVEIRNVAEQVLINTDKMFSEHHELKSLLEAEK